MDSINESSKPNSPSKQEPRSENPMRAQASQTMLHFLTYKTQMAKKQRNPETDPDPKPQIWQAGLKTDHKVSLFAQLPDENQLLGCDSFVKYKIQPTKKSPSEFPISTCSQTKPSQNQKGFARQNPDLQKWVTPPN